MPEQKKEDKDKQKRLFHLHQQTVAAAAAT
jgi:hypothetical protein